MVGFAIGFGFGSFPAPLEPTSTLFSIVSFRREPVFYFLGSD